MSTSVSQTSSATPTAARVNGADKRNGSRPSSRGNRMPVWLIITIAVIISTIAFLIVWTQGHVNGQEFSPTHFQARDFHFYEIPLLHIQMTPIRRRSATPATATYVRQNSLIPPVAAGAATTWHLVHLSRGVAGSKPADAELLMNQLAVTKAGDPYWRTWSVDHPEHAKLFWPVIQRLANRELYVLMPRLFEIAQQAPAPDELVSNINDELRNNYSRLIQDMLDAGRTDLAQQLYGEAIVDYPDDDQLKSLSGPLNAEMRDPKP